MGVPRLSEGIARRLAKGAILWLGVAGLVSAQSGGRVWITDIAVNMPTHNHEGSLPFRAVGVGAQNDTNGAATFDVSCSWACPAGNIRTWTVSVQQGAYLEARKSREFESDVNMGCQPLPGVLTITCDLMKKAPPDSSGKTRWETIATANKRITIPQR